MKKILLVDDSRTSLFMERMILQQGPYKLLTACDGQEGVDMAKQSWGMLNDPNVPPEAKKAALDGCTQGADALKQGAKALGCEI